MLGPQKSLSASFVVDAKGSQGFLAVLSASEATRDKCVCVCLFVCLSEGQAQHFGLWMSRLPLAAEDAALARMLQMLKPSSHARWVMSHRRGMRGIYIHDLIYVDTLQVISTRVAFVYIYIFRICEQGASMSIWNQARLDARLC